MKKMLLLLSGVCLLGACHKKEYPTFHYSQATPHSSKASAPLSAQEPAQLTTQAQAGSEWLMASADERVASVVEAGKVATADLPQPALKAPARASLVQKLAVKKWQKKVEKAQSPQKARKVKAKADTVSLLSLIMGGGGLLLLVVGSGLGLLLGLAGMILGIVGLSRINRGAAPASSRTLAILGVVFGGIVVLLGILAVAIIASYGFV